MRYENLQIEITDKDFFEFHEYECKGEIHLYPTTELINITNNIRKLLGEKDLVGNSYNNNVYYEFYLYFNTKHRDMIITAMCVNGENDNQRHYNLPITREESKNILIELTNRFTEKMLLNVIPKDREIIDMYNLKL